MLLLLEQYLLFVLLYSILCHQVSKLVDTWLCDDSSVCFHHLVSSLDFFSVWHTRNSLLVVEIVVCSVQLMRSFEGLYLSSWKELPGGSVAVQGGDLCSSLVFLDSTNCSVCFPVCLRKIRTTGLGACSLKTSCILQLSTVVRLLERTTLGMPCPAKMFFILLMASVAVGQFSLTISMNCD